MGTVIGFWELVEKSDACWLWTGGTRNEYGWFNPARTRAHRHSYLLAKGPIPDGLMILHTCDVKLCVRPDHLYAGTAKDNGRDF